MEGVGIKNGEVQMPEKATKVTKVFVLWGMEVNEDSAAGKTLASLSLMLPLNDSRERDGDLSPFQAATHKWVKREEEKKNDNKLLLYLPNVWGNKVLP